MFLTSYFEDLYRPAKLIGKSPNTVAQYRQVLRHFHGWTLPTVDVADDRLCAYLACMFDAGYPAPTCNKHRRHVLAVVRHARRRLQLGPPPDVDRLPEALDEPTAWNTEQVSSLLLAARQLPGRVGPIPARLWWPALLLTVYDTGARISAIMSVRSADLSPAGDQVYVRAAQQKHRRGQWYRLHPQTAAAVAQIAPGRLPGLFDDWQADRTVVAWPGLNAGLRRILRAAGLPTTRRDLWHKIRRTCATYLAAARGTATACDYLGHSSLAVTRRYIDTSKIDQVAAADVLPRPSDGATFRVVGEKAV